MEEFVTRTLACRLSQGDVDNLHRQNGEDLGRIMRLKEEAAALQKRVQERERCIRKGVEDRDVDCRWEYNFTTGYKRLIRLDTHDVIEQQVMTTAERQKTIDGTGLRSPADSDIEGWLRSTPREYSVRVAGLGPRPAHTPTGELAEKHAVMDVAGGAAVWNGERWAMVLEVVRGKDSVTLRMDIGSESMAPTARVWTANWPEDGEETSAPLQLPPAPGPAEEREDLNEQPKQKRGGKKRSSRKGKGA